MKEPTIRISVTSDLLPFKSYIKDAFQQEGVGVVVERWGGIRGGAVDILPYIVEISFPSLTDIVIGGAVRDMLKIGIKKLLKKNFGNKGCIRITRKNHSTAYFITKEHIACRSDLEKREIYFDSVDDMLEYMKSHEKSENT